MSDRNEKFKGVLNAMRSTPAAAPPAKRVQNTVAPPTSKEEMAPPFRTGRPRKSDDSEYAWKKDKGYHTSVVFDREQYKDMKEFAYRERLSLKSFMEKIINLGLVQYKKNGLK